MRYRVLPYKQGSKSAKALADAIKGKVLKLVGSTFVAKPDDVVIKWGHPSNKLQFFELLKDKDLTPKYWTNKEDIPNDDYPIVCRTVLSGHSGAGIVIADNPDILVDAPLYVKYEKKKEEYRVHLGKRFSYVGQNDHDDITHIESVVIIALQRKARSVSCTEPNWKIRSHSNGFNFVRGGFIVPACVLNVAMEAFQSTELLFGAVDVIYNEQKGRAYVLEINTAPGLEGQTIKDYADFFRPGYAV